MTAITIEPGTGRKIFNTRAAKASDKIKGQGYGVVTDTSLTTLPEYKPGAVVQRRRAGEVPGVQGGPARLGRLHADGGRSSPSTSRTTTRRRRSSVKP